MTGFAIIFMHEREDGRIEISTEVIGECPNADVLSTQLMHGMLMLEGVHFSRYPNGIAAHPNALEMQ
jgi:hypothetical protein